MASNAQKKADTKSIPLPIKHVYPEGQRSVFVNHMLVDHTEKGEFRLSFYEVIHPSLIGDEADVRTQLEELGGVEAHCVARISISAERMPNFIAAMAKNYETYCTPLEETEGDKQQKPRGKKHAG